MIFSLLTCFGMINLFVICIHFLWPFVVAAAAAAGAGDDCDDVRLLCLVCCFFVSSAVHTFASPNLESNVH